MIKNFDKTFQEIPKSKPERKHLSIVKRTSSQKEVSKCLLNQEALDLMLLNCERKLLKLNHEAVKKDILSIDKDHQNKILLVNQQDLSSSDRLKSAIKRYRYQAQLHPDSAVVQTNLGKLYHKNQQLQEAINCYKKAIAIDSSYDLARKYLAQIISI